MLPLAPSHLRLATNRNRSMWIYNLHSMSLVHILLSCLLIYFYFKPVRPMNGKTVLFLCYTTAQILVDIVTTHSTQRHFLIVTRPALNTTPLHSIADPLCPPYVPRFEPQVLNKASLMGDPHQEDNGAALTNSTTAMNTNILSLLIALPPNHLDIHTAQFIHRESL